MKKSIFGKGPENDEKRSSAKQCLGGHFEPPSKIDEKIDAKIDAEKVMKI